MKKKAFALFLTMAVLLALPTTMLAQSGKKGGLFGTQTTEQNAGGLLNQNGNRDGVDISGTISNFGIGEDEVPLGSGIAFLLLASAGYVTLKRKKED